VRIGIGLPARLQRLFSNLPIGSKLTPEIIIENHSILPLFYPFLKENSIQKIKQAMMDRNAFNTQILLGWRGRYVSKNLKFCQLCLEEDEQRYGEPYWHRVHQLIGVFYCPKHGIILTNSNIKTAYRTSHQIVALTKEIEVAPNQPVLLEKDKDFWRKIANACDWLLQNPTFCGQEIVSNRFKYYLKIFGLVTYSGTIRRKRLNQQLKTFLPSQGLEECDLISSADQWHDKIMGQRQRDIQPLRYILFMLFLNKTPEEFLLNEVPADEYIDNNYFGKGPWPCLNHLADHYLQPVITDCEVNKCQYADLPIGKFSCSCGFIYSRLGPDLQMKNCFTAKWVIQYGHEWETKILKLYFEEHLSFKTIAEMVQLSEQYIWRRIRAIAVNAGLWPDYCMEKKNTYRNRFLTLSTDSPHLTRSELREKNPSLYRWLLEYDAEWLKSHLPPCKRHHPVKNKRDIFRKKMVLMIKLFPDAKRHQLWKIDCGIYEWLRIYDAIWFEQNMPSKTQIGGWSTVDWLAKDYAFSKVIEETAEKIKNMPGKPRQVSHLLLERESGLSISILPKRMKIAQETLSKVTESLEEFQIRKIAYGVSLVEIGMVQTKSAFCKSCGVRNRNLSPRVKEEYERALNSVGKETTCYKEKGSINSKSDK
jgi:DNA-binding Lrp family transcriptional regulator